jgi:hypothetical protein
LATATVSGGTSLGVFGAVAKTVGGQVKENTDKITALKDRIALLGKEAEASKGLKTQAALLASQHRAVVELNARLALLPLPMRKAVEGLLGFQLAWKNFVAAAQPAVLSIFARALAALAAALPKLMPLFNAGAHAVSLWVNQLARFVSSGGLDRLVRYLATQAGPALVGFGKIVVNLAKGFAGIGVAFGVTSRGVINWLVQLTARFAAWGKQLGSSAGFQAFLAYVRETGPAVRDTFKQIALALPRIVEALTPLGPLVLAFTRGLADLIRITPTPVLAALIGAYITLSVVMNTMLPIFRLYQFASKGVVFAMDAVEFSIKLCSKAALGTRIELGLLAAQEFIVATATKVWAATVWLVNKAFLSSPIGWIVLGIAAVIAVIVLVATKTHFFQNLWNVVWRNVKAWTQAAVTALVHAFDNVMHAIDNVGHAFGNIGHAAANVWRAVRGTWDAIVAATVSAWNFISAFFKKWWPLLLVVFAPAIAVVMALWNHFHQAVFNVVKTVWNAIKTAMVGTWKYIQITALAIWYGIRVAIVEPIKDVWVFLVQTWKQLQVVTATAWKYIQITALAIWRGIYVAIVAPVEAAWKMLTRVWDRLFADARTAWNAIKLGAVRLWNEIYQVIIAPVRRVWTDVVATFNLVRDTLVRIIRQTITSLKSQVVFFVTLGKNIVAGVVSGIVSVAKTVWKAIVDFLNGALAAAKKFLGIKSPSTVFAELGKDILRGLWAGLKAIFTDVINWFKGLPKAFLQAIGIASPPQWAVDAGRHIMSGILKGLAHGAPNVKKFFTDQVQNTYVAWSSKEAAKLGIPSSGSGNPLYQGSNAYYLTKLLGQQLASSYYGWTGRQWDALRMLWDAESGWNPLAKNPTSTAFGIPQFLASTAKAYGVYGVTDPAAQIIAGMRYISSRYGNPALAWAAWLSRSPHWYGSGGLITEPIFGVGRSGRLYGFGERGVERVTPGAGGGDFTVTAPLVIQMDGQAIWQGLLRVKRRNSGLSLGLG